MFTFGKLYKTIDNFFLIKENFILPSLYYTL